MAFVLLAWQPLLLALGAAAEPGGWHEKAGIALGLVGLSLLLLQFAHSGRWHLVSGRNGIDVAMRFHRAAAILVLVMALLHPVLFVLPLMLVEAPFAIIFSTDANVATVLEVAALFPAESHPAIAYPFAITRRAAGNGQARALLDFITGPETAATWQRFGFTLAG
ncbi:solute-binding protein [Roseomonas eburnea]|uniref:Solute-binding protein n=1 Tax=Neoroseomonas eburnea TaxID=1346889 RepID=A0A9X9X703_9PROT|nr:solute-binding protein [Neoroseomonas eburnea]